MKLRRNGFTLIELLIAAALVGILTMFATQSFRRTASDIRVENAKRAADTIAVAAYRFKIAYPSGSLNEGSSLANPGDPGDCQPSGPATPVQKLVDCGFLDTRKYLDTDDFNFVLSGTEVTVTPKSGSPHSKWFVSYTTGDDKGFVQTGYDRRG